VLDLAANQLKWQHCWRQSYANCTKPIKQEFLEKDSI